MQKNNNEKKHSFRDFKAELKKVIWPTPKQLVNNTIAVITIVLIVAVIVFVLDFAFENANKFTVNKVRQVVESREADKVNVQSQDTETIEAKEDQNDKQSKENEKSNNTEVNE